MSYATAYHDPPAATDAYSQDVQMTANSPASEATYNLTASTFIKDDKDDGRSSMAPTTVMLATAIIVFVLASGTIMLLALGFGFGSNDQKTETHQHDEVAEDNLGDVADNSMIVPEFRLSTALTTRSGVEGSTSHYTAAPAFPAEETIMETTLTPPTLSTVPLKKIKWQRLLCTVGTMLNPTSEMIPHDGLCDYMFYDSVYKRGPTTFEPNNVEAALSIFLSERQYYLDTKFGIGFAYKYRRELKLQLSANGGTTPFMLRYFWDQNICEFGILDTPTSGLDETALEEMLESLKMLHEFSISQRSQGKSCLVVFAGPAADTSLENIYFEKFSKIFTPDIVVILSHYGQGDNTMQDCHVMPPTVLTRPPALGTSRGYKEDLRTAADTIGRLTARGVNASWALSVTMKGRWTVLKAGQPPNFLSLCEHDPGAESFGSYTDVSSSVGACMLLILSKTPCLGLAQPGVVAGITPPSPINNMNVS
ncbi:uncharacterized protein [Dermacentor albipictus]|uniref:uncharacterized protein n=1 Tax=Dermacentor albipictus TaxID=60249 RepID=UPI0038FCC17E